MQEGLGPQVAPETMTVEAVLDEIRARRDEFDRRAHVPRDMVAKLKAIGVYRALVPKALGGDERRPADFFRLIERIAAADGSTGWVASFGCSPAYLASLPRESFEAVFRPDPDAVFCGPFYPVQKAPQVPGGWKVNGAWKYASGCMGADWMGVGIKPEGLEENALRMAMMPAGQTTIREDWEVIGLRATGSHTVVVEDVVVAPDWTFTRGGKPSVETLAFLYPSTALAGQSLAVVSLGVARAALDTLRDLSLTQKSVMGAPPIGARAWVQRDFAAAEAQLRSARAYFYDITEEMTDKVAREGGIGRTDLTALRLSASNVVKVGAEVTRSAFFMAGTSATFTGHPIARCMLDAAVIGTHAIMGEGTWEAAGAIFFDQPVTTLGYP